MTKAHVIIIEHLTTETPLWCKLIYVGGTAILAGQVAAYWGVIVYNELEKLI